MSMDRLAMPLTMSMLVLNLMSASCREQHLQETLKECREYTREQHERHMRHLDSIHKALGFP